MFKLKMLIVNYSATEVIFSLCLFVC